MLTVISSAIGVIQDFMFFVCSIGFVWFAARSEEGVFRVAPGVES
jgi:hypothetical protein